MQTAITPATYGPNYAKETVMPYFQDTSGGLHYLSDADITNGGEGLLPEGCVEITDSQAAVLQNPPLTQAQLTAQYEAKAQGNLDALAQSWGYDNIVSAASYANSTVAQYKADALALIAWRDATWQAAEALQAQITAGTAQPPATETAFIALMPIAPARPTASA
jgi:hypothetical protein